jgi:hypothetical protein
VTLKASPQERALHPLANGVRSFRSTIAAVSFGCPVTLGSSAIRNCRLPARHLARADQTDLVDLNRDFLWRIMTHGHPFASGTVSRASSPRLPMPGAATPKVSPTMRHSLTNCLIVTLPPNCFTSVISIRQVCALLPEQHVAASPAAVSLSLPVFRSIDGC